MVTTALAAGTGPSNCINKRQISTISARSFFNTKGARLEIALQNTIRRDHRHAQWAAVPMSAAYLGWTGGAIGVVASFVGQHHLASALLVGLPALGIQASALLAYNPFRKLLRSWTSEIDDMFIPGPVAAEVVRSLQRLIAVVVQRQSYRDKMAALKPEHARVVAALENLVNGRPLRSFPTRKWHIPETSDGLIDMFVAMVELFRQQTTGSPLSKTSKVEETVHILIALYRPVVRHFGIDTFDIEYHGVTVSSTTTHHAGPEDRAWLADAKSVASGPIQLRIETVASIINFLTANADNLSEPDQAELIRVRDDHLARLERAYVDGRKFAQPSTSEEIDMSFAVSLDRIRGALAEIRARLAIENADRLKVESAFIEVRHGNIGHATMAIEIERAHDSHASGSTHQELEI